MFVGGLQWVEGVYAIHRLAPDGLVPEGVYQSSFYWVGKTDEELSIVCPVDVIIEHGQKSDGWVCLKVQGPIDFSVTGVLAGIAGVLAEAEVSILALSTFDTDYILVRQEQAEAACRALHAADYKIEE